MSATYNWAYKPGVVNKYGIVINASSDIVAPSNAVYVALFGNDNSGNGSRQYPYRTLTKAISTNPNNIVIGSGTYRELAVISTESSSISFIGDGEVIIDISYLGSLFSANSLYANSRLLNLQILGNGSSKFTLNAWQSGLTNQDVHFNGSFIGPNIRNINSLFLNCIFENYSGFVGYGSANQGNHIENCTFINCNNVQFSSSANNFPITNCLFYNCNLSATLNTDIAAIRYCLFFQCNFKLTAGLGNGGTLYPSVPYDYIYYETIADLQSAYALLYSTLSFTGCTIDDPNFNNVNIGDYTLSFNSPAKNLSYYGTYVGALSIAQCLKIRAIEAAGDFDFSTAVNVTIADDSITLTNPALDAVIETKIIQNTLGRQLKSMPIVGFNADRNGQYIDSIADLDVVTKAAGDILPIPASYLVENGSITYNAAVYTAGQRLTTVTGQTTFTTTTGGALREILECPQRHTIEMKLGDVQPFTTEAFNHFEPGITPTTNNVGDSRIGAIVRGNGDPAFVRGVAVEFPVNSKYIKIRFTIRANNLKP